MRHTDLETRVTGRSRPRFLDQVHGHRSEFQAAFQGKRVLLTGGAGSIGSAMLKVLLGYDPAAVTVVDQSENSLVELIRELRSTGQVSDRVDLRLTPLDFGSGAMRRLVHSEPPFDVVMHFAAVKHVRSEKDAYSILQMLETNVLKTARLLDWLCARHDRFRFFAVSTDKAANPVNLMGASKRIMENVIFKHEGTESVTSARFANVAFSDGSLLDGVLKRIALRQLVAVPSETRRYFVSATEAAQLCLLACVSIPTQHLLIPTLDPRVDLREVGAVVGDIVRAGGFKVRWYVDEEEARRALASELDHGCYPVLLTRPDTDGEKPFEEFIGDGEQEVDVGIPGIRAVHPQAMDDARLATTLSILQRLIDDIREPIDQPGLVRLVADAVGLRHVSHGRSLDAGV